MLQLVALQTGLAAHIPRNIVQAVSVSLSTGCWLNMWLSTKTHLSESLTISPTSKLSLFLAQLLPPGQPSTKSPNLICLQIVVGLTPLVSPLLASKERMLYYLSWRTTTLTRLHHPKPKSSIDMLQWLHVLTSVESSSLPDA